MEIKAYLERLDKEKEVMIERVIQWANINTHSFNTLGLARMATLLIQSFSTLACEGAVLPLNPVESLDPLDATSKVELGSVLRFWKRPTAPIQVLLVGHMDTVYDREHPFQRAIRKDATLIQGPGVTDMKGGLCVMLEALKTFEQSPHASRLGWEVLINPDEEIGSLGSADLLVERAKFHQVGLLFEPAMNDEGVLAGERKGSGNFSIVVYGRAAHAGRDFLHGRNAIVELAEIMAKIHALNGKREGVTFNIGHVRGGGSVNVVAALAMCHVDVRTLTRDDEKWVRENLDAILVNSQQKEGFKVDLKGAFHRKPKILDDKTTRLYHLVAKVGQEIDQSIRWKPSGGCSDGNNLADVGLPNVDTLGVCGGKIHSDAEYLLTDSLVNRAKLSALLLLRLSEGKF